MGLQETNSVSIVDLHRRAASQESSGSSQHDLVARTRDETVVEHALRKRASGAFAAGEKQSLALLPGLVEPVRQFSCLLLKIEVIGAGKIFRARWPLSAIPFGVRVEHVLLRSRVDELVQVGFADVVLV